MQLCPQSASSRGDPKHPSKACRFSYTLVAKAYRAAGQAASSLHAMATLQVYQAQMLRDMHEGRTDPGLFDELRAATDLALRATKVTARSLGQVMSTCVVQERHLWLNLADMREAERTRFLDTPISQAGLFGAELNTLIADKTALKQKQWQVQLQMMDLEKKAAKASFDRNSIPDPVYLPEVQKSLTKIQDILIQLKNFWESVGQLLDSLEQTTFVGEALIEDLDELKDVFLDSIKIATEAWSCFGAGCQQASVIFKLQNKDAYKFLKVSPSSLSKEEWEKDHHFLLRLKNLQSPLPKQREDEEDAKDDEGEPGGGGG
ncbi:unnamed protein product [Leuciscus chuanchicus]